ncbi:hypothetical protein PB2503_01032 [Parvularcula bermudensis HTCC2503]|uniref:AsmA-like C-terminal domain-containing protein n=1 Tax=Parvularcula bermudensis (strain ATCC BAA-594 / HTCC2503 / KCTC 12087) TaxID=314260 RepID=E0TB83_PARBH|nr:AsmA-like C-terminal region-containing protein [Parvularcula bermudensis]ADM08287.1 hypothetical protein PB2503_01032 [Parvularcula bermudensis HTCC2503]
MGQRLTHHFCRLGRSLALIFGGVVGLVILTAKTLSGDGVSLAPFEGPIRGALSAAMPESDLAFEALRLIHDEDAVTLLSLKAERLDFTTGTGTRLSVPNATIALDVRALIGGQVAISDLIVDGGQVSLGGERAGPSLNLVEALGRVMTLWDRLGGHFDRALFRDFRVDYGTAEAGLAGTLSGDLRLSVDGRSPALSMDIPFEGGGAARLRADLLGPDGYGSVRLELDRVVANEAIEQLIGRDLPVAVSGTLNGEIDASLPRPGQPATTHIDLRLHDGTLTAQDRQFPFDEIGLVGVATPGERRMEILDLRVVSPLGQGRFAGSLTPLEGGAAHRFALSAPKVDITADAYLEGPLALEAVRLMGTYDWTDRLLSVTTLKAGVLGSVLTGNVEVSLPQDAPLRVAAEAGIPGPLSPQDILRAWPLPAADGVRRWAQANILAGTVTDIAMTAAYPPTPDQAVVDLSFRTDDTTVRHVPTMSPITDLSGRFRIHDNRLLFEAFSGRLGAARVTGGSVDIPQLIPREAPATFAVQIEGSLRDVLSEVDKAPQRFLTTAGYVPRNFGGQTRFDLEIVRPMKVFVPIEDYRFSGSGVFSDLSYPDIFAGVRVSGGEGTVTLAPEGLTIAGDVETDGMPTQFRWHRGFAAGSLRTLDASMRLSASAGESFGLALRRFVRGEVITRIEGYGQHTAFDHLTIGADLKRATLLWPDGTIFKAAGEGGTIDLSVARGPEDAGSRALSIEDFSLKTPGAIAEGQLRMGPTGGLDDLKLTRLWIAGAADLALRAERIEDGLVIEAEGRYVDATPLIGRRLSGRPRRTIGLPGKVSLDLNVDKVDLKAGTALHDLTVSGLFDGERVERLIADGRLGEGTFASRLAPAGEGQDAKLMVETSDFGQLLRGLFGIESVWGAAAAFEATLPAEGGLYGEFRTGDLILRRAPTVARLLSIASLDGLENILNGEGIAFDGLVGQLSLAEGMLSLSETRMTGSSLGLTAGGQVDFREEEVALFGSVVPAYPVNSLAGKIPGIGDLFISREGEGMFAIAYRVTGEFDEVRIDVNSAAALTPGILRRLFEPFGGANSREPDPALSTSRQETE